MAENFYTILTKVGLAKVANAQLTADKVNFATIVAGDGNGGYYNPESTQTALKKEVWRGAVGSISIDENNPNWIVVETVIPATVGGFTIREIGLLDDAGDMLAIGKYPQTYKPVLADGSSKDLYIRMIIEVANASVVTLKVDPTIVIASRKYVDDKIAGASSIVNQAVKDVADGTITILPLETVNKTLSGAINELKTGLDGHKDKAASITEAGHVQLSSALTSTDETKAATPNAIKKVNDAITTHSADDAKHIKPTERTKLEGIEAGAQKNTVTSVAGKIGAVSMSKADVGLGSVDDVKQASKTEFDNHLADETPQVFTKGLKKYKCGFKTNDANDGLVFVYEEVL